MIKDRISTEDRRQLPALAITIAVALLPFALRRVRERVEKRSPQPVAPVENVVDVVEEASKESFPASDPPAY